MPPRRKGTISTKDIKGTISTEEIGKADDNVSNLDDPLGFAAAGKRRGRNVAISAKEKGGSDNVDVLNTEVSVRSSKQKALHKILSMDKEDTGDSRMTDASAIKPSLEEAKNDCSGAKTRAKQNNVKKQGPRAKKALNSIPEGVVMEANFVDQGSKLVSDEVKDVLELCTIEEKPDRGKSRRAHAKENNQCKLRTEQEEKKQEKESQQGKMVTCQKFSRKRGGSSMLASGQSTALSPIQALSKKTTDCLSTSTEKLDSLSVLMSCTQEPPKPDSKKDQTLYVRSSTRTKKVVNYSEQSPKSEEEVFVTAELKPQAANKRNASIAKLLPGGAKRVKKDPTSTSKETLALDSARADCVKRERRHQKLRSPQNLVENNCAAFINPRETGNVVESREHRKESNSEHVNSSLAINSVDLDKALLLQTAQPESVKFSPDREGTSLRKTSNKQNIMHGKKESDHIAHNKVSLNMSLAENSEDQIMADEWSILEMSSIAAGKSVVQHSIHVLSLVSDTKTINTSKKRKVNSKQKALPDTAQRAEGDLLDALLLESDAEAKPLSLDAPLVHGAANSKTVAEPEEICGSHLSIDAARKSNCESRNAGRKIFLRKSTFQGTAQQAKKQKNSVLDTPAQNLEHDKVIQGVESQGWNAVDITISESRVERSSEKKRREEIKRKRAMKFDALPVGFGLGISCWSTPPWANQSIEEEGVGVVDLSVMRVQGQSESPMELSKKQCLQGTAMLNDGTNISLGLEDTHHTLSCSATEEGVVEVVDSSVKSLQIKLKSPMEEVKKPCLHEPAMSKNSANMSLGLEDTYYALPCSAMAMQASSFSISDAERLPGSGIKPVLKNNLNQRQEKAKVKSRVTRKTKASNALLLESVPAVPPSSDKNILDKENLEPKLHVHYDESENKMSRSSRRRLATASKERTTRTRRN